MTDLKQLVDVSTKLLRHKEELERYQAENYLHNESRHPWININISVGNHPTYLKDFRVSIVRPEARAQITKIMLVEIRAKIKSLEAKLRVLRASN